MTDQPMIRCERVYKSYQLGRTELTVLRGIDLEIHRAQFLSIMGSSGSGKSTLLHIMGGLDVPQRGQVHFNGHPMFEPEGIRRVPLGRDADRKKQPSTKDRPKTDRKSTDRPTDSSHRLLEHRRNRLRNQSFGFVFQFYHLLPEFDVLENVLLPQIVGNSTGDWLATRAAGVQRGLDLLERVGLEHRLRHLPNELSGGERQRVAIARALMNQPEVLFADEPTGNLDAASGSSILRLLKELNDAGQTIVMVTHDRELARQGDTVVQLVDGRVK
ncbi:MAG: ABC transporter ATP-binding protein [Planctomycetota bacterium]|nr:ABC transporter ATP-binding protein [Planctomycetota bacterium]